MFQRVLMRLRHQPMGEILPTTLQAGIEFGESPVEKLRQPIPLECIGNAAFRCPLFRFFMQQFAKGSDQFCGVNAEKGILPELFVALVRPLSFLDKVE